MVKFTEVKIGDYVMAEYEGQLREGVVTRLNGDEKQICVETDVQDFWYEPQHVYPIPINDESLLKLNFIKEETTENKILQAAKKVFITKGLDGARMQDIADEAGINKALLHYYFRSKDKLFEVIFMEAATSLFPKIVSILDEDISLFDKLRK